MIKLIAALDTKRGIANEAGIPWQGKLPSDVKHFRDLTRGAVIVMGYKTYQEFVEPLPQSQNHVVTHSDEPLRPGFSPIKDIADFLHKNADCWIIGGAGLFAQTIVYADELYLTRVEGDYGCTKFFPDFEKDFELINQSELQQENGISFYYQTFRHRD